MRITLTIEKRNVEIYFYEKIEINSTKLTEHEFCKFVIDNYKKIKMTSQIREFYNKTWEKLDKKTNYEECK